MLTYLLASIYYGKFNCCFKVSRDVGVQFNYSIPSRDVGVQFIKPSKDVGVQFNYLMPMSGKLPVQWNVNWKLYEHGSYRMTCMHIIIITMPISIGESWLATLYMLYSMSHNWSLGYTYNQWCIGLFCKLWICMHLITIFVGPPCTANQYCDQVFSTYQMQATPHEWKWGTAWFRNILYIQTFKFLLHITMACN